MLKKSPVQDGKCEVTFQLPAEAGGAGANSEVHLCGEFNDWSQTSLPMVQGKKGVKGKGTKGDFEVTVLLETGRRYRYRYLIDGVKWENDWQADDYQTNEFGGEDSVVEI